MEGEYTGHVKDGKVHGVGVCVYTDGSRYQGDWKAGLKCGRGTHSFASGDQFEGEWENGWMHGLGGVKTDPHGARADTRTRTRFFFPERYVPRCSVRAQVIYSRANGRRASRC